MGKRTNKNKQQKCLMMHWNTGQARERAREEGESSLYYYGDGETILKLKTKPLS